MSSEVRVDYENMPSQSDNIRNTGTLVWKKI